MKAVTAEWQGEWRPLCGYEQIARISKKGIVETLDRNNKGKGGCQRKIKGQRLTHQCGRNSRRICIARRNLLVSRAVYESWVRPLAADEMIAYRDGDNMNCDLSNIIIVKRGNSRRLTHKQTRKVKSQRKGGGVADNPRLSAVRDIQLSSRIVACYAAADHIDAVRVTAWQQRRQPQRGDTDSQIGCQLDA